MFEVLVFVYENYWRGDACPEPHQLQRKLSAVGFEADEIHEAMDWLSGLNLAAQNSRSSAPEAPPRTEQQDEPDDEPLILLQSPTSLRVYSVAEQDRLGASCLGFIIFLESSGVLPASMREIVIDRAMAVSGEQMLLDDLKIIILMVYWSFGEEPDALVLDELCDDSEDRLAH